MMKCKTAENSLFTIGLQQLVIMYTSKFTKIKLWHVIIPPYANQVICTILLVKSKYIGLASLHCLAFGPTVQILSIPWADSTVVPCVKVVPMFDLTILH